DAVLEPGTNSTPANPVEWITWSGCGRAPRRTAVIVTAGSSCRVVAGPHHPWVRLLCGSVSTMSTRFPNARASVPARWCVQLVLPTPPFWFRSVTTGMRIPPSKALVRRAPLRLDGHDRTAWLTGLDIGWCAAHQHRESGPPRRLYQV